MTPRDLALIIVALLLCIWLCERQRNSAPTIRRRDRVLDLTGYHIKKMRRRE